MSNGSKKNLILICVMAVIALALTPCVVLAQSNPPEREQEESEQSPQSKEQSKEKAEPQEKGKPTPTPQAKKPVQGEPVPTPRKPAQAQSEPKQGEKPPQATPTPSPTPTATPAAEKTDEASVPQTSPTPAPTATEQPTPVKSPEQAASPQPTPSLAIAPVQESQPAGDEPGQTSASLRHELDKLAQSFTFWKIVLSLLVLTLGYLINRVIVLFAARIGKQKSVQAERLRRMTPFISFGLWFLVVGLVTGIFVQSMLATVALMAIVIIAAGVASQPLLRDLIGGIVILFERPFQIGDRVTIGPHQGEVKVIGLRSFHVSNGDGSLVAVPNSEVLRQAVVNASLGRMEGLVTTELPLPAGCNLAEAKQIAFEAAAVSPYISIHQPVEVLVDVLKSGDSNARLIVRSHVFDVQYERELRSDTIERAQEGFNKLRSANEEKR